jgi:hypothetical protein
MGHHISALYKKENDKIQFYKTTKQKNIYLRIKMFSQLSSYIFSIFIVFIDTSTHVSAVTCNTDGMFIITKIYIKIEILFLIQKHRATAAVPPFLGVAQVSKIQ